MRQDYKRYFQWGVILFCMIAWIMLSDATSDADWAYFTPKELEEQADLIVLGTVEGPIMEQATANSGYTDWEVTVSEYLKHSGPLFEKIVVTTPGNRANTGVSTSTDYSLDEQGSKVLLFLDKSDEILRPITPNAVIAVEDNRLRAFYGDEEENKQLQTLLDEQERFTAERGSVSEKYERLTEELLRKNEQQLSTTGMIIISGMIILAAAIITTLFVLYGKRKEAR